jgi:tetratricopeptide (TPR) repeat protein
MVRHWVVLLSLMAGACSVAWAAPDQWVQVSSSHFIVVTNSNEKQARHILDQLERMRWVFQILYPKINADPSAPIQVFAAKNARTFQSVEPQAYLAKGQLNLAGYFLTTQDKNFILLRLDADQEHPFATVYHEYTHLQFRSAGDWMPLWLNEGIAEFFQNTEIRDKDVLVGEPSSDDILYLRQQALIPLPVLFKVDASSPYYHEEQKGSVFYAESWALVHFLEVNDKDRGTHSLGDYATLMSQHKDSVEAATAAFGDLKRLQSALQSYIQMGNYKEFVLNSAKAPIDETSYTAVPISQIQADAARAEILADVERQQDARDLIKSILNADPGNVLAREVLGNLELRAGNREEARKWYGEAIRLDSKSCLANYYFAAISLQSSGSGDPEIESSLRTAIQLNPKFAPSYELLASYYAMRHNNLAEALSLITTAVSLDPGNLSYRLNASQILVESANFSQAATVLQTAMKLARNPGEVSMVQSRIDQLSRFQQMSADPSEQVQVFDAEQKPNDPQVVGIVADEDNPQHPSEATGPKHSFVGVMRQVVCSAPAEIEFRVDGSGSSVKVYNNDFSKIDLTVVGFTPKGPVSPCTDFDGMKARIQYAESTDKSVDGKVFAIELRK